MSGKTEISLSVLFDHELRLAAQKIREAVKLQSADAVVAAFRACRAALHNVDDSREIVVVKLTATEIDETTDPWEKTPSPEKKDDFPALHRVERRPIKPSTLSRHDIDQKLFHAARRGNLDAARAALDKGADPNAKNEGGWTSLHVAAWYNRLEFAALLIDHGANVNARDEDGETPLHKASWENCLELAALLRKHGATK